MRLTKRQKEILDFLTDFIDRQGYSPSMEEIASHLQGARATCMIVGDKSSERFPLLEIGVDEAALDRGPTDGQHLFLEGLDFGGEAQPGGGILGEVGALRRQHARAVHDLRG